MSMKQELIKGGHTITNTAPEDYHELVLKIVEKLVEDNPDVGSADGDLLDVLSEALVKYEAKYYPITDHQHGIAKWMRESGLRLTATPKMLVPIYQYRIRCGMAWYDITPEDYRKHMECPRSDMEFRVLYRGWE